VGKLATDLFELSTHILKDALQKARRKEPVDGEYLNFLHNGKPSVLDYSIEYCFDGNTYLVVNFNAEPQKIPLFHRELTFGTRTYLVCGCGNKTNALFLKLGYFACRTCQGLRYRSSAINPRSDHGMMLYMQEKRIQVITEREKLSRIMYRSRYTKPFLRWLKLANRVGFFKETVAAQNTMEMIKEYQSQKNLSRAVN